MTITLYIVYQKKNLAMLPVKKLPEYLATSAASILLPRTYLNVSWLVHTSGRNLNPKHANYKEICGLKAAQIYKGGPVGPPMYIYAAFRPYNFVLKILP